MHGPKAHLTFVLYFINFPFPFIILPFSSPFTMYNCKCFVITVSGFSDVINKPVFRTKHIRKQNNPRTILLFICEVSLPIYYWRSSFSLFLNSEFRLKKKNIYKGKRSV